LDSLLETVTALASARTLDDVTRIVRRSARELTHADGVSFVLKEDGNCFYADEDAIGPLWKGSRFPLNTCISGWAMLNREIVVVPDIYLDARLHRTAATQPPVGRPGLRVYFSCRGAEAQCPREEHPVGRSAGNIHVHLG
jgi:hypothetical protein